MQNLGFWCVRRCMMTCDDVWRGITCVYLELFGSQARAQARHDGWLPRGILERNIGNQPNQQTEAHQRHHGGDHGVHERGGDDGESETQKDAYQGPNRSCHSGDTDVVRFVACGLDEPGGKGDRQNHGARVHEALTQHQPHKQTCLRPHAVGRKHNAKESHNLTFMDEIKCTSGEKTMCTFICQ